MATPAYEVLLVDDQLSVRRGTELVLREAGLRVAGLAETRAQARGLLRRRRYDVALVETLLGGESTAPMLAELLAERPGAPVVAYAGRERDALRAATTVGVPGLVLKSSPPLVLVDALSTVADGGTFLDPGLAERLPALPARAGIAMLSPREREILGMLADGWTGAEIAGRLFLSAETVRTHVRNAVTKLGARTRTQAVALLVSAQPRTTRSLPRRAPVAR